MQAGQFDKECRGICNKASQPGKKKSRPTEHTIGHLWRYIINNQGQLWISSKPSVPGKMKDQVSSSI